MILKPICKIHKVPMREIGFERGYRIWHCELCYNKPKKNDKKNN